jgi:hypothetical protein
MDSCGQRNPASVNETTLAFRVGSALIGLAAIALSRKLVMFAPPSDIVQDFNMRRLLDHLS